LSFYFLESTALAKLFVQEAGSEKLIAVIDPLSSAQKLVSALGLALVYAAIRRRERSRGLNAEQAALVLQQLVTEFAQMTEQPLSSAVSDRAMLLLDGHELRADDAVQLASCLVARAVSGVTDFVFVTTNPALLQAARAEGLQTLNPEEA
jgi:predicted nucleic acid-binding protein